MQPLGGRECFGGLWNRPIPKRRPLNRTSRSRVARWSVVQGSHLRSNCLGCYRLDHNGVVRRARKISDRTSRPVSIAVIFLHNRPCDFGADALASPLGPSLRAQRHSGDNQKVDRLDCRLWIVVSARLFTTAAAGDQPMVVAGRPDVLVPSGPNFV